MKKFSDYSRQDETPKAYTQEDDVARLTEKIAKAYDGKPSIDMLREILKEAEDSKRKGTLTNEDIDDFYTQFSPLLDESQQKMLKVVVDKLKRI
ncbi:MAG: hypothetical protein IKC37_02955 [Clostridia bacterium]|nr:hypothetical protein [Clostridia bacterium]